MGGWVAFQERLGEKGGGNLSNSFGSLRGWTARDREFKKNTLHHFEEGRRGGRNVFGRKQYGGAGRERVVSIEGSVRAFRTSTKKYRKEGS